MRRFSESVKTPKGAPAGRGPVWGESGMKVTQPRPALCDSSVHGDSPGKDPGEGSLSLLPGIFRTRDQIRVSRVARESFTTEPPGEPQVSISESPTLIADEKAPLENLLLHAGSILHISEQRSNSSHVNVLGRGK